MRQFILWLCLLVGTQSVAQVGLYQYHIVDGMHDTTKRTKSIHAQYFAPQASIDSLTRFENVSFHNMMGGKKVPMNPYYVIPGKQPLLYKNLSGKRYLHRDYYRPLEVVLTVEDSLPIIAWQLKGETKQVGGFNCLRAEADIAGRHFVVWYTPDIPISGGPWKLYGLPGFILEGEDTKREVIINFVSLKFLANQSIEIAPFPADEPMKFADFKVYFDEQTRKWAKLQTDNRPQPSGFTFSREVCLHRIDFKYSLQF